MNNQQSVSQTGRRSRLVALCMIVLACALMLAITDVSAARGGGGRGGGGGGRGGGGGGRMAQSSVSGANRSMSSSRASAGNRASSGGSRASAGNMSSGGGNRASASDRSSGGNRANAGNNSGNRASASDRMSNSGNNNGNRVNGGNNNINTGNNGNRVNTGDVNIGGNNNINVDIDGGYGHCCGGGWGGYHPIAAGIAIGAVAVTTAAVVGSYYHTLPMGCTTVIKNGVTYSQCGSAYYQQTFQGNDVVYVVASP
jgi:hypothetical protein